MIKLNWGVKMRTRKIVKHGNSVLILLSSSDLKDKGWKVGDSIDIEDAVKVKK